MAERAKTRSAATRLEIENEALRALTLKLGRIVLASAGNLRMPIFDDLAPDQIATALRELSLECERVVRITGQAERAEAFEAIGIEFAHLAARIEAAFRIPAGPR